MATRDTGNKKRGRPPRPAASEPAPAAKKASAKNGSTSDAVVGFEEKLWQMADKLRNNMDAAEYKHVVLGLLFLKYISDAFEEKRAALTADKKSGADPEDPDEYRADNIYWVPKEARWTHLQGNAKQATIGKLIDDAMVALEAQNPTLNVDPAFLYWLFLYRDFDLYLVSSASGTKILHTVPSRIESFEFDLPPLAEQRAIARILGALDDKIELNRKTNATLEAMARALFKSWFVDFDPVRAKAGGRAPRGMDAETATLFPSEFVESELGRIPTGWRLVPVREVCAGVFDGPHATPPEAQSGTIFLGIRNFTPTALDLSEIRYISEDDYPAWTKRVVPASRTSSLLTRRRWASLP
ncbi:MAG: type I restriction-modification system subunit M N-terminal domain-containing protein [Myxococcales bacterium]|nr:type I restriction-modification system subunit M N-terminal domain-containing protein [Myxococcales bacterium]